MNRKNYDLGLRGAGQEYDFPSSDHLLVAVFTELAVLQGKRTPYGQWTDSNPWHLENALVEAMKIIRKAERQSATE